MCTIGLIDLGTPRETCTHAVGTATGPASRRVGGAGGSGRMAVGPGRAGWAAPIESSGFMNTLELQIYTIWKHRAVDTYLAEAPHATMHGRSAPRFALLRRQFSYPV